MTVRIGTSGWSYDHWTPVLYPAGTPVSHRLARYAQAFDTVELNASFYRWPAERTFTGWCERLPVGFTMSVKAHRGLTHFRRLRSPQPWVERFERCWRALGTRAEALLVQLPAALPRDDGVLDQFLTAMPDGIPVAVEFRDPSWHHPDVYALLERHRAAQVVTSGAGLPVVLRATAPFVYVRMHGPDAQRLYAGSYSDDDLRWWAERIGQWRADGRDVLVYFNNDAEGNAVSNARTLATLVQDDGTPP